MKDIRKDVVRFGDEATASIQFNDKLQMPTKRKYKISGQMIAPCSIARTGIMEYKAKECGALFADREPDSIVKIMTTEEELFAADSIDSYRSAPITIGHPEADVNTENAKDLIKGVLEGMPLRDGDVLVGTLVLNDADAISLVKTNVSQLSSGHTCILKLADEGSEWDAEKTMIRANHIAIVKNGRAGVANIADEDKEDKEEEPEVVVEEVEVEVEAEEAPKEVEEAPKEEETKVGDVKLQDEVDVLKAKLEDTETKLKDAQAQLADIDTLVEARMAFVAEALSIADVEVKGKSEMDIKRAVVSKVKGIDLKDKSDTYVDVRYQILLEDEVTDDSGITQVLKDVAGKELKKETYVPANTKARENMIKRNEGVK
jgi:hypothetical protein